MFKFALKLTYIQFGRHRFLYTRRPLSKMAIASTPKETITPANAVAAAAYETRVFPAQNVQLKFDSELDDGAFTAEGPDQQWIAECRKELRLNRCVGLPTETVYGLAANALDEEAVSAIYAAKNRPSDNPLIVHVSSMRMLRALYHLPAGDEHSPPPFLGTRNAATEDGAAPTKPLSEPEVVSRGLDEAEAQAGSEWPEIPEVYHAAIKRFWPGPLTIVLPRPACVPMAVLGGHGDTVAFRFPAHPVARAAISACGLPLAAPSANASGRPSPTKASHVVHDLSGRLPLVVDGGDCDVGVESTVLDAYSANAYVDGELSPCILRPGGVTYEDLRGLGGVYERLRVYRRDFVDKNLEANPTTPGMKYRHYAPTAPVHVFLPAKAIDAQGPQTSSLLWQKMQKQVDLLAKNQQQQKKIALVVVAGSENSIPEFTAPEGCSLVVRHVDGARQLAHDIFMLLRVLDETEKVDAILVQGVDEANEGLAVMNRLTKAASIHVQC